MDQEILGEFVAGRQNRMDGAGLRLIRSALGLSTCTLASRIGSTEWDLERLEKKRHIPIPIDVDRRVRELFLTRTRA